MNGRHTLAFALAGTLALTMGCAGRNRPATRPATAPTLATDIAPETATATYWLEQPPVVSVHSSNYGDLMAECDHVLRQRFFLIDRSDYRSGLLVSKPLVSKQFWEFCRSDVGTSQQVMASSVGTHRRIVQWQVREAEGGGFSAVPRVVVERISTAPRRVTSVLSGRASVSAVEAQTGLPTSGLEQVPVDHWYAIGRDKALEISLAEDLRDRMQKHPSGATLQRTHATGGK